MVEDSFEDAREHGIEPEIALRSNAMYSKWHEVIEGYFPDALTGNAEQIQPVIIGVAALLGELIGVVQYHSNKETAERLMTQAISLSQRKTKVFLEDIRKLTLEQDQLEANRA